LAETKKTDSKAADKKGKSVAKKVVKSKKRKIRRVVPHGFAHIKAGFNNTLVTITDETHATLCWASSGGSGFKGARKSTPYAAQIAAKSAAEKSKEFSMETVDVFVKGIGPGREQAVRGLSSAGLSVESITDKTTTPHGGCRQKRPRRV
jgi:small subunit ribosomal protein S11